MENLNYETKLYTNIWEFRSPFSYEETLEKIKEWEWILKLTRYEISNRVIRNDKWEQTMIDCNTEITVRLDTNICYILAYEEYKMKDIIREDKKVKSKK